jgi:hypothetical protein
LDTYGNVACKSVNEETSAIYNILQDFRGKYKSDCDKINIAEWVDGLELENNELEELMSKRFDESASKPNIVVRDARKKLDNVYSNSY